MLCLSRTSDPELVRRAVVSVWDQVADDFAGRSEAYIPVEHPSFWYVAAHDGDEYLGCFLFEQRGICFEVHTCLLPSCGPFRAVRAARGVVEWIWQNTPARRIITNVPAFNRGAYKLARLAGLQEFGANQSSFQRGGELYDQILLGVSKPPEGRVLTCP
jgi:hypothetical protein